MGSDGALNVTKKYYFLGKILLYCSYLSNAVKLNQVVKHIVYAQI